MSGRNEPTRWLVVDRRAGRRQRRHARDPLRRQEASRSAPPAVATIFSCRRGGALPDVVEAGLGSS